MRHRWSNFAVQSHLPGGGIGQTRFIVPRKGRCRFESAPGCKKTNLKRMTTKHSNWNGYDVYGDIRELDAIVESTGFINLDKDDVIGVLSADGENCVTIGIDNLIDEAFTKAINELPYSIDKINNLLISFHCGHRQPDMTEISKIPTFFSDANSDIDVKWGIAKDNTLGDSFKVILVASANR